MKMRIKKFINESRVDKYGVFNKEEFSIRIGCLLMNVSRDKKENYERLIICF